MIAGLAIGFVAGVVWLLVVQCLFGPDDNHWDPDDDHFYLGGP